MVEEQTTTADLSFDVTTRVRSLEGKYNLLRDRVLIISNNTIEEYKEIKSEIFKIKESMRHILKEMEMFAPKEDMKFLEKYINLWNPMKFVTEQDVLRIIENKKKEN
jgi:predicted  nucleic acid-binding Zn-ribbon protein